MASPRASDSQPMWQAPSPFKTKPTVIARYVEEILLDRESNLKTTAQYKDIDRAFDLIANRPDSSINEQRSQLTTSRAKRSIREINAALSDVRQTDGFDTENKAFKDEAAMLNSALRAIYYERNFDRSMKRCVQWFTGCGEAYIYPNYRKVRMGPGSDAALCFDAYGILDVFPFMTPSDFDNQGSYANIIVKMVPLPWAHQMFPQFQGRIKPMSKKRYDSSVANKRMSLADLIRGQQSPGRHSYSGDYAEIRMMLVRDMSINTTGIEIPMGDKGGSQSYIVPYVGQEIPSHETRGGQRLTREATIDDCYFYPHMRLIICFDGLDTPAYDGPNFDWSGMMPAKYTADAWPWERVSYSLIRDIYELERARQHGERAMDQVIRHRMDPSISYDASKASTKEMEGFDPWKERGRQGYDGEVDEKTIRPTLPEWLLQVPEAAFKWQEYCNNESDYLLGLRDISAMAKAKMGLDGDAMEKLLELAGPLVKDISRTMEPPTREVLEISKWNIFQWYGTRRLMSYVGPDGVTPITFDFDPEKLYPSHMDGEDNQAPSAFSSRERAKNFARNLHLNITPNSLHAVVQTAQKLLYLQLWRGGFPISPMTVAKALDLPNWGIIDGNTQIEQFWNYKKQEIMMASQLKELAGSLQGLSGPAIGGATPAGSQRGKGGRPPSGNKPPAAKTKGSAEGPRAVVTES